MLDILSKLLAKENITLIRGVGRTAHFDTKSRELFVPYFVKMSEVEELLFVFHEIGHALYSPFSLIEDCLQFAKTRKYKVSRFMDYLNVVEDVRIEMLVKQLYPGARKFFYDGYAELSKRGFFGPMDVPSLNSLGFADRLNISAKVGRVRTGITFSKEEKLIVNLIDAARTESDVLKAVEALYQFCSKNKPEAKAPPPAPKDEPQQENSDGEAIEEENEEGMEVAAPTPEQTPEEPESEPEDMSAQGSSENSEEVIEEEEETSEEKTVGVGEKKSEQVAEKPEEDAEEVTTVRQFEFSMGEHISRVVSVSVRPVISSPVVELSFEEFYSGRVEDTSSLYQKALERMDACKSAASYMFREFSMKKAATRHSRTLVSNSGSLDMNKVSRYKIDSKLFKTCETLMDDKNHGIVILLDMSGSMGGTLFKQAAQEIYTVIKFCSMAQLPFRVYGFADAQEIVFFKKMDATKFNDDVNMSTEANAIGGYRFGLVELATSEAPFSQVATMFRSMLGRFKHPAISFGSTPTVPALLKLEEKIALFKTRYNCEKMTTLIITDGAADQPYIVGPNKTVVYEASRLEDKKMGWTCPINGGDKRGVEVAVLGWMKRKYPEMKIIGYFITNSMENRDMKLFCDAYSTYKLPGNITPIALNARKHKEKFFNIAIPGFDAMFVFRGATIEDDFKMGAYNPIQKVNAAGAAKRLKDAMSRGVENKILMSNLMKEIC